VEKNDLRAIPSAPYIGASDTAAAVVANGPLS